MARKQQSWERRFTRDPCPQCGFQEEEPSQGDVADVVRGLNDNAKQKLAQLLRKEKSGKIDLEGSGNGEVEETEESLLITPDVSSTSTQRGYGILEESSQAIEGSEERMVKKKGKARKVDA